MFMPEKTAFCYTLLEKYGLASAIGVNGRIHPGKDSASALLCKGGRKKCQRRDKTTAFCPVM
jgi:hypothetical protein